MFRNRTPHKTIIKLIHATYWYLNLADLLVLKTRNRNQICIIIKNWQSSLLHWNKVSLYLFTLNLQLHPILSPLYLPAFSFLFASNSFIISDLSRRASKSFLLITSPSLTWKTIQQWTKYLNSSSLSLKCTVFIAHYYFVRGDIPVHTETTYWSPYTHNER